MISAALRRAVWRFGICLTPVAVVIATSASASHAQDYPNRPVRVIVALAAGGPGDVLTRVVVENMGTLLGQRFFVDNRPGAGSNLGFKAAANADPDGYTLLAASTPLTINPHIYKSPGYDPVKDFAPISRLVHFPLVLVTTKDLPVNTLQELLNYARAHPEKLNFGSSGNGSTPHLAGALFNRLANTQVTHVPYQSIPAMLTDMLGGRIQLAFVAPSAALSFVTERRLKALAMVGSKRSSAMPEVPSALEAGMPAFDMVTWYGLLAPRGTPDPVLQRLHGALSQTMRDSEIHKKLTESGAEVVTDESPAAFKAYVDRDVEYWRDIVRDIKTTIE